MHYYPHNHKPKVQETRWINVPVQLLQQTTRSRLQRSLVGLSVALKCFSASSTYRLVSLSQFCRDFHTGKSKGKNKSAFAESVGMQQRTVYNYLTGNRKPKAEFLQAILKAYPDISPEWLLKGEGDMLIGFPSEEMANRICKVVEASRLSRVNFAKHVGVSIEELEVVLDHLNLPRPSIVPTIISKYPFLNGEWLLRGIGSMYKDPNQTDFPETHMGWETLIANEHEGKNTKSRMFIDLLFAHRSKIPEKDMQEMLIKVLENDSDALREFVQKTEMERSNLEKQIELLKRENELLKGDSQQSDLE